MSTGGSALSPPEPELRSHVRTKLHPLYARDSRNKRNIFIMINAFRRHSASQSISQPVRRCFCIKQEICIVMRAISRAKKPMKISLTPQSLALTRSPNANNEITIHVSSAVFTQIIRKTRTRRSAALLHALHSLESVRTRVPNRFVIFIAFRFNFHFIFHSSSSFDLLSHTR